MAWELRQVLLLRGNGAPMIIRGASIVQVPVQGGNVIIDFTYEVPKRSTYAHLGRDKKPQRCGRQMDVPAMPTLILRP